MNHDVDPSSSGAGKTEQLDFERASFEDEAGATGPMVCRACGSPIATSYYARDGEFVCERCAATLRDAGPPGSAPSRLVGASVFGLVAAAVGCALWMLVTELTGYEIGLIAIAVGWIVGLAVQVGNKGVGGVPYQLLAVFLTYSAIVMTYVPAVVEGLEATPEAMAPESLPEDRPFAASEFETEEVREAEPSTTETTIATYLVAAAIAFAVPFLSGLENAIGILIIGFALYQAWSMTKKHEVIWVGPFQVGSDAGPGPG